MSGLNPIALAAFIQAPDADVIMSSFERLSPEVRASFVSHLALISGMPVSEAAAPQAALPPPQNGLTGETKETRIVERRLRGETIGEIATAEDTTWAHVKATLREAKSHGCDVTMNDPYKRLERTEEAPKKRAAPRVMGLRQNHPDHIRKFMADKRMAGVGPQGVLAALKEEHNYTTTVRAISAQLKLYARKHGLKYPPIGGPPSAIIQSLDEHRQQQIAN